MNVHKNARLTPRGREWVVSQALGGQTPQAIAQAVGVCRTRCASGSTAIGWKAPQDWPTAVHGPTGSFGRHLRLLSTKSRAFAAKG